jgi:hypothetical protein
MATLAAGIGGVGGENDRSGNGGQAEYANPQNTRGSQGCAKHKLPRPNFSLDHRFVRPNYAQRRRGFPCAKPMSGQAFLARMADQAALPAKTLSTNNFSGLSGNTHEPRNQVRRAEFPKA